MSEVTKQLQEEYAAEVRNHIGKMWSVNDNATLTITARGVEYKNNYTSKIEHVYDHSVLHAAIKFLRTCGDVVTEM